MSGVGGKETEFEERLSYIKDGVDLNNMRTDDKDVLPDAERKK